MKNFVIRVYRQDEEDQNQVIGIVEHVEESRQTRFSSMDELIRILCRQNSPGKQIEEDEVRNAINGHTPKGGPDWGDICFEGGPGPGKGGTGEREN